ncbi:uncharacterized protein LOC111629197 [Centruroides sculpturatus]|uniref:uncharacterized protein LOC111629197 n=1 Tax=Centruroides sculpturatus TaxID=218467 RepID=UPI000C6D5EDD|nr:uncharacterized protein LOC111629197 [Centruroides sculpturatus]
MPQGFEIERIRQGFEKLRKGYPSVVLQAVCDYELKFLDVYAGWPGSANDARTAINNGHLTRKQKFFNTILSSTRVVIEQAFAHLFGRFWKLIYIYVRRRKFVPDVIVATCVLHNLCIMHNDSTPDVYDQLDLLSCHSTEQFDAGINKNASGAHKRDQIADYLFNLVCV